MKKVILLVAFLPYLANGQIIENFESATLNGWIQGKEGTWSADTAKSISGRYSLHHIFDNSSPGSDCIGLPIKELHPSEGETRWTFSVRYGYNPSSSNNWCTWLMSDADPASFEAGEAVNGYAVGVNISGYDDTLRLWKIKEGSPSVIVNCPVNWQNDIGISNPVKIVVERSAGGAWKVFVYDMDGILKWNTAGTDSELFRSSFFILNYRYTASADRLLWFDELMIEGVFYEDRNPPSVTECTVSGISSVCIRLSEEPDNNFMMPSNFSLNNGSCMPINVEKITDVFYNLSFNCSLSNKVPDKLHISKLCDRSGNCNNNIIIDFIPVRPDPGDVIISEIMADPTPVVSLPGKEYLEIMNRTKYDFNLKKWSISDGNQKILFPSYDLKAGEYLILCSISDTSLFSGYGNVLGLKSFLSLTDEGKMLYISDSLGNLVHGLEYSSSWYGNKLKAVGGWSLEMIDTDYPFYFSGNWEASLSPAGGTPGRMNSGSRSNPDRKFIGIENVFPEDSVTVVARFSETVFQIEKATTETAINEEYAASVSSADPLKRAFIIRPSSPLKRGEVYRFKVSDDITDFAGNEPEHNIFLFGLPDNPEKGDIFFNELLFNPYPDDPDYIELVNCSGKIIDASRLLLVSVNDETSDTSDVKHVSSEQRCIVPGSYYTATTDRDKVTARYFTSDERSIFNTTSFPSMPDDKGHLLLYDNNLEIIDEVKYTDKMHYPLLVDDEGVSLEKVRPDILSAAGINWHSASESSGWGTPGTENSIYIPDQKATDQVHLSSKRITPDNDGNEDVLIIDINAAGSGNIVSVTIFDETGSYVRKVCENMFAESRASVVWDGTTDNSSLVSRGIYIVFIELYNDKGKTKSWKKVCAVIRR